MRVEKPPESTLTETGQIVRPTCESYLQYHNPLWQNNDKREIRKATKHISLLENEFLISSWRWDGEQAGEA